VFLSGIGNTVLANLVAKPPAGICDFIIKVLTKFRICLQRFTYFCRPLSQLKLKLFRNTSDIRKEPRTKDLQEFQGKSMQLRDS